MNIKVLYFGVREMITGTIVVGAMIVRAMIVGAMIVGTKVVGAMIVGAMRRPRHISPQFKKKMQSIDMFKYNGHITKWNIFLAFE